MKKIIIALLVLGLPATLFAASTIVNYTTKTGDTINGQQVVAGQRIKVYQTPIVPPPPVVTPPTTGSQATVQIYDTFYGWPDNTPHNSSILSTGGQASGDGTYANPITAASGYVTKNGQVILDYPYGTKIYIPNERKYFVIADECGDVTDGSIPCHTDVDHPGVPQIDLWAGGVGSKNGTSAGNSVVTCEEDHTRINTVIFNPASNYVVVSGNVFTSFCGQQFGDVIVTQ